MRIVQFQIYELEPSLFQKVVIPQGGCLVDRVVSIREKSGDRGTKTNKLPATTMAWNSQGLLDANWSYCRGWFFQWAPRTFPKAFAL